MITNKEKRMQRNTFQRQVVLSAVQTLCHATADEIHRFVAASHPGISKATVYRNLGLLSENGQISHIEATSGADYFDCTTSPHYHLQCTECGKIFDVPFLYLGELNHIPVDPGFTVTGHTVLFKGVCALCNNNKERKIK